MSDERNALNLVDQLLNNEKEGKQEEKPKQKKVYLKKKKKVEGTGEFAGNPGFNKDLKEEYWPGDIAKLSAEMKKKAHLPDDGFVVVIQTATSCKEATVFCPWYSIYGWGASTRAAMDACINNVADYWTNFPEAAKAIVADFKDYVPRRKELSSLLPKKDDTAADILMAEGL